MIGGILFLILPKKDDIHPIRLPNDAICEISGKKVDYRFAVQLHKKSGKIIFFDSVGSFIKYISKNDYRFHYAFIMDYHLSKNYESEKWINARVAFYIKTDIKTPDGSGYVGFISKNNMQNYLDRVIPKAKVKSLIEWIRELRKNSKKQ